MQTHPDSIRADKFAKNTSEMDQCIRNCLSSFQACEETLTECLSGKKHEDSKHLILLKSCAEICHTSAKFMMMQSEFHFDTCGICAKVCTACADSCEELNDPAMNDCIKACRKCAESCGQMARMKH
jgi:hypothetical protein